MVSDGLTCFYAVCSHYVVVCDGGDMVLCNVFTLSLLHVVLWVDRVLYTVPYLSDR